MSHSRPSILKWVCSPHALQRIVERKISVAELSSLIETPDLVVPQGAKWIFAKKISGRIDHQIAAVLLEKREHNLWVVLTVMINFAKK